MAKIIDRDVRRKEILQAFLNLVGRSGRAAATTRALAQEAGISSGALWHYFDSIDELIVEAFRLFYVDLTARMGVARGEAKGLKALSSVLGEILPLGETGEADCRVAVAFLNIGSENRSIVDVQVEFETLWLRMLHKCLDEAATAAELHPAAPTADLAELILSLAMGLQMEFFANLNVGRRHKGQPRAGQPARQWELVDLCLRPWLSEVVVLTAPLNLQGRRQTRKRPAA